MATIIGLDPSNHLVAMSLPVILPGGRLTASSTLPLTLTDQTSVSTIYYLPYVHNQMPLYNGIAWGVSTFTSLSISMAGLEISAPIPIDIFVWNNAGTLQLVADDWLNTTTRNQALTQIGGSQVWVNAAPLPFAGVPQYQATYVGTAHFTSFNPNFTEDSLLNRYIWNAYNRRPRKLYTNPGYLDDNTNTIYDITNTTWTIPPTTGASGTLSWLVGLAEDPIDLSFVAETFNTGNRSDQRIGIGEDSTTQASVNALHNETTANNWINQSIRDVIQPIIGGHYAQMLLATGSGTMGVVADIASSTSGDAHDVPMTYMIGTVLG